MTALVLFGSFIVLVLLRTPIGVSLGMATLIVMEYVPGAPGVTLLLKSGVMGGKNFPLVAVPMFILAGDIMLAGKLSEKIIGAAARLVGNFRAGLAYVNVLACMFFAAISGSSPATVAAIGSNMIPEMEKRGYPRDFSAALTAASGMLGVMIPPSIPLIIYGVTANQSIGALFMAGIFPGILFALMYIITSKVLIEKGIVSIKEQKIIESDTEIKTDINDKAILENNVNYNINNNPNNQNVKYSRIYKLRNHSAWALLIPVIILGGIYGGIFTPTEAAAVAVIYAVIIGLFVYQTIKFKDLPDVFARASVTSATCLVMVVMAFAFGRLLAIERIPFQVAAFITQFSDNKWVIIALINILLLIVGMFMETIAAIIILTPILLPIMISVNVNPIHFGIILTCNLAIGFCTPPLGVNLFVASSVGGITIEKVIKAIIPFLIVMFIALILISYIPSISLWLPSLLS